MDKSHLVIKNSVWDILYYGVIIILGFFVPKYIVQYYGSEVNGLTSSITQILNVIMLLQAGAVTASIYSLYEPIANNNIEQINIKYSSSVNYFKKISFIFLVLMIIGAVFTSLYIKSGLSRRDVFIAFLILGIKSFFDLYYTSKFSVLFTAHQKKYVLSIALMIEHIIYYSLVFVTILFKWNYLFLFISMFVGCLVKILILLTIKKKDYNHIKEIKQQQSSSLIPGKNYALVNEISHSLTTTSIAIIISFLYGLQQTSVYSVYMLVYSAINLVLISIASSFGPSFAILYASGDREGASRVFGIFSSIFDIFSTVLLISAYSLILPFIEIYIGANSDYNYFNPTLALFCTLMCIFYAYRLPFNILVSACGFFKETWLQPSISAFVSILVSLVAGKIDYSYVILGPLSFYLTNYLYQYFRLKKLLPDIISKKTFLHLFTTLAGLVIGFLFTNYYYSDSQLTHWLLMAISVSIIVLVFTVCTNIIIDKRNTYNAFKYLRGLIKKNG